MKIVSQFYLITADYHGNRKQTRATAETMTVAEEQAEKYVKLLSHDGDRVNIYLVKGATAQQKLRTWEYQKQW